MYYLLRRAHVRFDTYPSASLIAPPITRHTYSTLSCRTVAHTLTAPTHRIPFPHRRSRPARAEIERLVFAGMPGKYNHASTYQSCETISTRQQYVRAAAEQLSVWRCACESDTLGAVAIMVKSERRGDRIISAFTGREAPAGSCHGSVAEAFRAPVRTRATRDAADRAV